MDILFVGIGGALGSLVRYQLGKAIAEKSKSTIPIGTFIINISGAFLLGIVSSLNWRENLYLLLGDGFLGAYTTFSTFMYEGMKLFQDNDKKNALVYVLSSIVLGIIGYGLGYKICKII